MEASTEVVEASGEVVEKHVEASMEAYTEPSANSTGATSAEAFVCLHEIFRRSSRSFRGNLAPSPLRPRGLLPLESW